MIKHFYADIILLYLFYVEKYHEAVKIIRQSSSLWHLF